MSAFRSDWRVGHIYLGGNIGIGFGIGIDLEDDEPVSIPIAVPTLNMSGSGFHRIGILFNGILDFQPEHIFGNGYTINYP